MADYIKRGLFRKKTTKYKTLWCNHADWLIFRALAARSNRTIIETMHEVLIVYNECQGQNHKKQIEDLDDKLVILAAELRKYRDRFGIIKD
jgi:hypothetical protein